jgi:hypothetical protein
MTGGQHPYSGKPARQFWKHASAAAGGAAYDPLEHPRFVLAPEDRIVTAGSCFAQHVARHLTRRGYNHLITEPAHPLASPALAERHNYGIFAARYGNIYTARQLRQLLQRAYGEFQPRKVTWFAPGGRRMVDPFRPNIQPGGFVDEDELLRDQAQHFAAVRRAVEELDVFVFTLGLTEAWYDRLDGAVFPLAPGVAGGRYEPERHRAVNFSAAETAEDLRAALAMIRARNPGARAILTVSPVPLNATFEDRDVWVSTTVSKAALRLAAEEVVASDPLTLYFPSYEIITHPAVRGRYFAEDARQVLPEGVAHVMEVFERHLLGGANASPAPAQEEEAQETQEASRDARVRAALDAFCDEEMIDRGPR